MDILFLIGRIIFGGFFVMMGLNHFMKRTGMVQYAQSKGVPAPGLAVAFTGLMLLLGGLGVVVGAYTQISLWLIIIFLLGVTFQMHNFWTMNDPQSKMVEMSQFMKNMALLGAALMMLQLAEPWVYLLL